MEGIEGAEVGAMVGNSGEGLFRELSLLLIIPMDRTLDKVERRNWKTKKIKHPS